VRQISAPILIGLPSVSKYRNASRLAIQPASFNTTWIASSAYSLCPVRLFDEKNKPLDVFN
jgi:hypothetical protein